MKKKPNDGMRSAYAFSHAVTLKGRMSRYPDRAHNRNRILILRVAAVALFTNILGAAGQNIPKGFLVPDCTRSPDGRYGVTVPIVDQHNASENPKNSVIELKTGKIIAVIKAKFTGWNRMNNGGVLPCRWSVDDSLLLWEVEGKWFHDALVLLKFQNGGLVWQTDLLAETQKECLSRTKRAAPAQYAKAKKANAGNGSAYPEGFSIEVIVTDQISLPLNFRAALTSDPKGTESIPQLGSSINGVVDENGKLVVTDFRIASGAFEKLTENSEIREPCDFEKRREKQ